MTNCRKSHVTAHAFCVMVQGDTFCMLGNLASFLSSADFFFIFPLKIMTEKKLNADINQHESSPHSHYIVFVKEKKFQYLNFLHAGKLCHCVVCRFLF